MFLQYIKKPTVQFSKDVTYAFEERVKFQNMSLLIVCFTFILPG